MKKSLSLSALIFLIFLCQPSLLSAQSSSVEPATLELGSVSDVYSSGDYGLQVWGLAKSAKFKMFSGKLEAKGQQLIFSNKIAEIVWFAQLSEKGKWRTMFKKGGFRTEWFSPDGRLYFKEDLTRDLIRHSTFMHSVLKLPQPLPTELLGVWRVKVFKKEKLLDDRRFQIIKEQS